VFVFSTTLHEASHAFVAHRGGDSTAYEGGQVTLDPMPHIKREPVGMVVVPLLSFFMTSAGWMLGWASAPYNPYWGQRYPRRKALMSLAGPAANLLLATVAFIAIKLLIGAGVLEFSPQGGLVVVVGQPDYASWLGALAMVLSVMLVLNVLLGIFNLLPVPPLDGAGVVEGSAPRTLGPFYEKLRNVPAMGLLGLLVAWLVFPRVGLPVLQAVLRALI
jgi:Zn-dependent protease